MHDLRSPTHQACLTTLSPTPIHSKTLIPPKGSNPHVNVTSQALNPLRHARNLFPNTPDMSNHPSQHSHTQQKSLPGKGFEPACQKCQSDTTPTATCAPQRFPPCQTVSVTSHTTSKHSKRVCPLKGSNLHVKVTRKPQTHCAMREQRFPPSHTVSITSHTLIMHRKRVCPLKDSNLHVKVTSQGCSLFPSRKNSFLMIWSWLTKSCPGGLY